MKNTYKDAGYTYTINRLQETARTFRNLGDAYGETNQKQTGFKRQLILAADILEECVAMNLDAKAPDKQERREFERKCMAMGISDRKSTRLNSSHKHRSRMPSSA